ncbi:hypothetical protein L3556_07775 [Candidatus Synechococcus calcipolaris G9]|uniref:Transposase n=2 Tax=Synechococcus TaxID=1129 RepID=A0ABT6EZ50_9SYNE|nr:hypothetical protein [Candidatus Synechococcus calcipolaris]MDG2990828.1 hypothetical protein [Candidatus Synechococcus calcipolaris G9]
MGLTESALRQWVKQATIDQGGDSQGALTTQSCRHVMGYSIGGDRVAEDLGY